MSTPSTTTIPAGWYPDPAGAAQWRLWNGRDWTTLTKPYNTMVTTVPPLAAMAPASALRWVRRVGIPAYFGGLGLLLSTLAHWPGTAQPTSSTWAVVAGLVAVGTLSVATILCGYGVYALQGHWSLDVVIPGLNLLSVMVLVLRRLGVANFTAAMAIDAFMIVVVIVTFRQSPLACLLLMALTRSQMNRVAALLSILESPVVTA